MSKIIVTIDTEEKSVAVDVNGTSVPSVTSFSFYMSKYSGPSVSMSIDGEVGGIPAVTTLYASESKDGKEALQNGLGVVSASIPDFIEIQDGSVATKDIAKFFGVGV